MRKSDRLLGLNLGAGVSGLGVPAGDVGRLFYNLISSRWIADVPTARELRDLFVVLAAKEKHPELAKKPAEFLTKEDIRTLETASSRLSPQQIQDYLERISEGDVEAMVFIARLQRIDAKVSNFLGILTSAGKVRGVTERSKILRVVFNNVNFSLSGDLNLKTIIALALGHRVATPLSGTSLESLSQGQGPAAAWLQYFDVSIDIRALINTLGRIPRESFAEREVKKPLPYATKATDLAAYEVRIFGFPLLLFYKRGLIRDDLNAYNEDYAYGIDGPHIVEHFKTREEMEAAIRAHRMWPLGFVQIPNGNGGWRDSNLPVFAHAGERMQTTGRPTLVIYGLKAYAEQSQAIERERERFRLYERALEEGAVIEQLEEAEDRSALKGVDFEAKILPGTNAVEQLFSPILGALLETRRQLRREAWGITSGSSASGEAAQAISFLESRGIPTRERDCLLGVDAYYSTFRFEHRVSGQRRVTRMTHIPSLTDIRQSIVSAEKGREIEALRRKGISPEGRGVVLLNEVRQINGSVEVGSQLDASGSLTVDAVLDQIERLPVVDRARLDRNRFAATRLNLGVVNGNQPQPVFVTIEFPIDTTLIRDRTNLLSGARERLRYLNGRWLGTVTERRIMELGYDVDGREIASRIWHNAGTLDAPSKGLLLQETRTVETWPMAQTEAPLDPYSPTIAKIQFDHVTGRTQRELFGLFPLPIATADDQFVTETRFSPFGVLASATTSDNGRNAAEWQRPLLEKLVDPITGNSRFTLTNQIPDATLTTLSDLRSNRFTLPVARRDLLKQTTKSLLLDNAYDGRIIREEFVDAFDGTRSFAVATVPEYRDDFFFGLVPVGSRTESVPGGARLTTQATVSFDPASRQLVADETDHTGKSLRHTWDPRWEAPVVTESTARRTVTTYNRVGTSLAAVTTSRSTSEELVRQEAQLEPDGRTWSAARTFWFRPGITNRVETHTLSSFGKLIATRSADIFEARPVYDADGRQTGVRVQRRSAGGTGFDVVHRVEDDFQWQGGALNSRVQTFLGGQPHDLFRAIMDAEGRTVTNQIKNLPNLTLHTAVTSDGDSERLIRAETFQNGRLRLSRVPQAEARQPDGSWLLPVRVVPAWGLPKVETFTLGEPLGRPTLVTLESGDQLRTTVWYDGTAISQATERYSRSGLPKERATMQPAGIEAGIPYDVLRVERLTPWGNSSLAETRAMVRGTDIALFSDTGEEKTYFDLADPLNQPAYGIDPHGRYGVTTELSGRPVANVLTLHTIVAARGAESTAAGNETLMRLAGIDLRGLFSHKISFKTIDAGGNLIDERIARIPNLGDKTYSDIALRQALSAANPTKRFRQRFERGWLIEQPDTQTGGRMLVYTNAPPAAGTRAFAVNESGREFPTEIEGIKASAEELDPLGVRKSFFRTSRFPALRESNPYMPGVTNVWTSWITTESKPDGTRSFDSETLYDAQGRLAVSRAAKSTSSGRSGSKMVFQLTDLPVGSLTLRNLAAGPQRFPVDLGGQQDFSGSDFLVLHISSINRSQLALTFADAGGTSVMVTNGTPVVASRHVNFWPVQRGETRWLPDSVQPEQGTSVTLSPSVAAGNEPLIISVHDLDKAGLDIRRIASVALLLSVPSPQTLGVSSLHRLNRGAPFISSAAPAVESLPPFSKLQTSEKAG